MKNPRYLHNKDYESNLAKIRVEENFTVLELAAAANTSICTISGLQNGMFSPVALNNTSGKHKGSIKYVVERLCKILNATVGELFPRYVCDIKRGSYLTSAQILNMSCGEYTNPKGTVDEKNEKKTLRKLIIKALATLTPREESVLRKRFIDGLTLESIGKRFNISRNRVRQIEAKALRKLRHPTRSRILKQFI